MLGVVLVNYHTNEEISQIAGFYAECKCVDHIVIVDNDSNDTNREQLVFDSDKIEVFFFDENQGYSKGNNVGIGRLLEQGCDQIIISNSDIEVSEDTIDTMIDELNKHVECGAVAPRMKDASGKFTPYRKVNLGVGRIFQRIFIKDQSIDARSKSILETDGNIVYQSFLPGSFFMFKASAANECSGFDEEVFLYREEEILGMRLKQVGYRLGVIDNLEYKHNHDYGVRTSIKSSCIKMRREFRSEKIYFKKYCGFNALQMLWVSILQGIYYVSKLFKELIKKML